MSNLTNTIPFTELWERLLTMARMDSPNNEDFAKGMINDVYTKTLPRIEDWKPIINESFLSMSAAYSTGTVTATAGSASITGSGTVWTSAMIATDGYKIKFAGNDNIYKFTYASGTTATISPALSGDSNITAGTYKIFRDEYSLVSDFDRFLKNGSLYVYSGGRVQDTIKESPQDLFREEFTPEATDPIYRLILTRTHSTTGYRLARVNPPPLTAKTYPYDYIQKVTTMTEYTTGTVAVTNASASITGTDTLWSANAAAGDYFRVDDNGTGDSSKWYKILTVGSNTGITLDTVFGESTESSLNYTICKAPTAFPSEFHEFILYEAILTTISDQGDSNTELWLARRNEILKDLKKNYKSRQTNVQFGVDDDGIR